jgi:methylenetetrahydrofolate dehydrogenase (NADP+) / methenyltetrahydrofolate cyclohydrolase
VVKNNLNQKENFIFLKSGYLNPKSKINNMVIIDGKKIAAEIKEEIVLQLKEIKEKKLKIPCLSIILVGNDGASETYVNNKINTCREIGFNSYLYRFESSVTEKELINKITEINNNPEITGLIVQSPLPSHISENNVIEAIDYRKDVDGFHPLNIGRMILNLPSFIPATPYGIMELFKRYQIETDGKICVILGRSHLVGTPAGILMSRKAYPGNSTVIMCHSRTKNISDILSGADIIIAAIGIPEFVKGNMVKEGAVVIDVGTTRVKSDQTRSGYKLYGDVKFDEVAPKCSFISPVPGGVGPMTIISLLKNTLLSANGQLFNS